MRRNLLAATLGVTLIALPGLAQTPPTKTFPLPNQTFIHDLAPAPGGLIWWTAQSDGKLGILDPKTGANKFVTLGPDSAPHGIIQSKDGKAWITDGGQNAIVSYDPKTEKVTVYKLPEETGGYTNLNTPTEDGDGNIWFTGQNGWHGKVDVKTGKVSAWKSPKGRGSYGMTTTPDGNVWFVSLANSYLGQVDRATGNVKVIEPPVPNIGRASRMERQQGRSLDVGVERRSDFALFAVDRKLGAHSASRQPARHSLRRLCRQQGCRLGEQLGRQQDLRLRPEDQELLVGSGQQGERRHPPDPRHQRCGVSA